jgi:hypothetical protein
MVQKIKIPVWEWVLSITLASLSGIIVWTNESIDLLGKLGIIIKPQHAIIVFGITFIFGLSWILVIFLRRNRYI